MAQTLDAVLIGAGVNTLACALHLAARGKRVAVFEAAQTAGGAVKTGAYTLPGFRHDWAAMNLSLFASSPFFKAYGAELALHGLTFAHAAQPFATAFPDGSWLGVSTDAAATTARIAAVSPQDGETWKGLAAAFPAEAGHLFGLLGSKMTLGALAACLVRALRAKGLTGTMALLRFLLASPRDWLDETFTAPRVRSLLAAWGMHLDFAPDSAGGALFPYLEAMAGQAHGMVIGQGGAATIITALVSAIRARGGNVETGQTVTAILHRGGQVTGIHLADGRMIDANTVIAGVAPAALIRLTGATANPKFDLAMTRFSHAPGTMMIHLAMRALPNWTAAPELQGFAYVHLAPSLDQMARTYQQAQAGLLPDEPILVVGQPTAIDPSRAPEGKHVLWLQVRMAPGVIKGDAKGEITAHDWPGAAEAFADRALTILESYAPGTRAAILGQHIVTPLDLEADNPNLVGGDQLCGSHHLGQHFVFRPAYGHARGQTPIKGLHLTGAAVWPGAGTGAGAGFHLAKSLVGT